MVCAGRVNHVNEAIGCFLAQSHPDKRLIVVNNLVEQTLVGDFPNVKIVNLTEVPRSLGHLRNIAISHAEEGAVCTWDSDDRYGRDHLANFAKHFTDGVEWVFQQQQAYMEANRIKSVVGGSPNVFAFTKKAFNAIGGYVDSLTVGEDRDFVGKLTSQFHGVKIPLEDFTPSFFYGWKNGVHHVSGLGMDKRGSKPAWERARLDLKRQLRSGQLKRGVIQLKPTLTYDYDAMAQEFLNGKRPMAKASADLKDIAIVALGRYGDLVNLLPICRLIAERYTTPHLVVSREFESLLEGVSYVIPYPVALPNNRPLEAIEIARRAFKTVLVGSIWGDDGFKIERTTGAYNVESWHKLGFGHLFDSTDHLPVFDRRNLQREQALFNKLDDGRPMILALLSGGVSSPFKDDGRVMEAVRAAYGQSHNIVDLSQIRAERIFDLVGLIERAACLVSIDSAPLHLAPATGTPFVCINNGKD